MNVFGNLNLFVWLFLGTNELLVPSLLQVDA